MIGLYDLRNIDHEITETIGIDCKIVDPNFNSQTRENDAMLVKLKSASNYGTMKLDSGGMYLSEEVDATVMGWSDMGECEPSSDVFLEAELDVVRNYVCNTALSENTVDDTEVFDNMICAARRDKDACGTDTGGPLIFKGSSSDEDVQVGVVQSNVECADPVLLGVFARVSSLNSFIKSTIANNELHELCSFPAPFSSELNYTNCTVEKSSWIGDGFCDNEEIYNTTECHYDGNDCIEQNCLYPDNEFDYWNCTVAYPCWLGDGLYDGGYGIMPTVILAG